MHAALVPHIDMILLQFSGVCQLRASSCLLTCRHLSKQRQEIVENVPCLLECHHQLVLPLPTLDWSTPSTVTHASLLALMSLHHLQFAELRWPIVNMRLGVTAHGPCSTSRGAPSGLFHVEHTRAPCSRRARCVVAASNAPTQKPAAPSAPPPGKPSSLPQQGDGFTYLQLDLPPPVNSRVSKSVFMKSSASAQECPPSKLPEFAVIGRSNVGKSSLINCLTGNDKLAKVSKEPGVVHGHGAWTRMKVQARLLHSPCVSTGLQFQCS
jgi:hypothetical protein